MIIRAATIEDLDYVLSAAAENKRQPASPPPASPAPKPETLENPDETPMYEPTAFDDPVLMSEAITPSLKLFNWQKEELRRLAGFPNGTTDGYLEPPLKPTAENPIFYNLRTNNGSGKDTVVIARLVAWMAWRKIRMRIVITSKSHAQLKEQTFGPIVRYCEEVNTMTGQVIYDIIDKKITCLKTGSIVNLYVTDDPGAAEGFHPIENGPGDMMIIINEVKSIPDDLLTAFLRWTGYNYWLEISSPGRDEGWFYKNCMSAPTNYPAPLELGKRYHRKVTAFECPNISRAHIEEVKRVKGEDSIFYRGSILAEFTTLDELSIISSTSLVYPDPEFKIIGLRTHRVGVDLALGGDETVVSHWHGNRQENLICFRESDSEILHIRLIAIFNQLQVNADDIFVDDGGIGKPIIGRLHSDGWLVHRCRNESRAHNPRDFLNRGAENYWRMKRAFEDKVLFPVNDEKQRRQLGTRRYSYSLGKIKLESKADARARGVPSPDRADAAVLAWSDTPIEDLVGPAIAPVAKFVYTASDQPPIKNPIVYDFSSAKGRQDFLDYRRTQPNRKRKIYA